MAIAPFQLLGFLQLVTEAKDIEKLFIHHGMRGKASLLDSKTELNMQRIVGAIRCYKETVKASISQNSINRMEKIFSTLLPPMQVKGLEDTTVAEVLMKKGEESRGPWICCYTQDTVTEAAKNMAQNNIGSLVVLKPGGEHIVGIVTERDYLQKILAKGRSPATTRVGEIMTNKNELITMTSDTNILQAMQLMTENQIRHVPVIDGKIVGMISVADVVRAVVEQQSGELKRLNDYIKGEYY